MSLPDGLYDLLLTEGLRARLDAQTAELREFQGDATDLLIDGLTRQLVSILEDLAGDDAGKARLQL